MFQNVIRQFDEIVLSQSKMLSNIHYFVVKRASAKIVKVAKDIDYPCGK